MNGKLKAKCDKLISMSKAHNRTLLYDDMITEISKNKDLISYSTTIPNALKYLKQHKVTVINLPDKTTPKPEVKKEETFDELNIEETTQLENDIIDEYEENEPTDEELEEIESEVNLNTTDSLKWYLKSVSIIQDRVLTQDEEMKLAKKAQNGDISARNTMLEYNLKLVVSIAKKYYYFINNNDVFDFSDIIQCGNMGLIKAIEKFDPNKGYKFSTYATWWIRQSITRSLSDEGRLIRLPVHTVEQLRYIRKAISAIQNDTGTTTQPSFEEIANYINEHNMHVGDKTKKISAETVRKYLTIFDDTNAVSIEVPVSDDEDSSILGDFIPDKNASVEEIVENNDLKEKFEFVFDNFLSEKEALILKMRFGFDGYTPKTLEQIGKEFGVTRERIRQIENIAKNKIRKSKRISSLLKDD